MLHELFKLILGVKGSIIGFDTFSGFPDIDQEDRGKKENVNLRGGGICADSYDELKKAIDLYDANRFLSHLKKVKLIKGDFLRTGPELLSKNKHILIALLYLDFDIYQPAKQALKLFLPRMPAGAVVVFNELNNPDWPGETTALLEELNLNKYQLKQFYYEPDISYFIL